MEVIAERLLDGEGNWAEMMFTKQKRGVRFLEGSSLPDQEGGEI
jgi:hypothetical protein